MTALVVILAVMVIALVGYSSCVVAGNSDTTSLLELCEDEPTCVVNCEYLGHEYRVERYCTYTDPAFVVKVYRDGVLTRVVGTNETMLQEEYAAYVRKDDEE